MKNVIGAVLIVWCSGSLYAIGDYLPGDTLYVWAVSGLTLREEPGVNTAKLGIVPFGTMLVVQNYAGDHKTTVEAVPAFTTQQGVSPAVLLTGDFARVAFNGKTGYLFDGYLSKLPPVAFRIDPASRRHKFEYYIDWATRCFGLLRRTQKGNFEHGYPHYDKWIFGNGILIDMWGEKGSTERIILPDISMEEAFLLLNCHINYEWMVRNPPANPLDRTWHFSKTNHREWHFNDGFCDYKILFLPDENVAMITGECSC